MADEPNKSEPETPEQPIAPEQPATPEQPVENQPVSDPIEPEQPNAVEPEGEKKAYGKRPWWQWLLIYVAVGAVVYGIIYFVLVYATGDGDGSGLTY
jgi:hypothetical protein